MDLSRRDFMAGIAAAAGLLVTPGPVRRYWQVPRNAPYNLRGPIVGKHLDYLVVDDPYAAGSVQVSQADIQRMVETLRANNASPHDDGRYHIHLPPGMALGV